MPARIYQPAKNAMQSGMSKTDWLLEYSADEARTKDALMGWTGSSDTQTQVRLKFDTKEAAQEYARKHGIVARVDEPKARKHIIRPGGYGDNFLTNRRQPWSH